MLSADRTDQRHAEPALREAYTRAHAAVARLTELDSTQDDVVATMSHELRTPLTSIAGYLEILTGGDAGPLSPVQGQMLDTMSRNVTRLRTLVEDLILVNSGRRGPLTLARTDTSLPELIRDAVDAATPYARQRDQRIEVRIDGGVGVVPVDGIRLSRAIGALLNNAVKASPVGAPVLVLATGVARGVRIQIADRGGGIPAEELERIFDRFYRTEAANRQAEQGIGLGLSIARDIVEAHGGQLTASSVLGDGSTFTIYLPVPADAP